VVVNERQSDALRRANDYLTCGLEDLRGGAACELVSQELRAGLSAIGEVVGQAATEDILSKIFSTFCIGK